MKKVTTILFFIIFAIAAVFPDNEEKSKPDGTISIYSAPSTNQKIKIDGVLDDPAWKDAIKIDINNEIYPGNNIKAPVRTEGYLISDSENIYVGIKAFDPDIKKLRANYSDRDQIWNDDTVGVGFDTFNSGNRAFFFASNPYGIQWDQIFSNGGQYEDSAWDAIWASSGQITDEGYVVEFKIPFNAIQFSGSKEDKEWGVMFFRSYPRSKRHMIGNNQMDRDNSCWICQLNKVRGFKDATPGKNLEFDPTLTGVHSETREDFPDGSMETDQSKIEPGLSGKWGITSNLNLSFAINPDFSQIEADAGQLDINTQYALYYDEKRPFFLEGKDFFNTPMRALYTRAVADPDFGLKLTGKLHKHALGMFVTRDATTNLIFPGATGSDDTTLEEKIWSSSFRYRYDIGRSSTVGVLMTDREGDNYFNRVGGIDGLFRISKSDTLSFQFLGSSTMYPDEISEEFEQKFGNFNGTAFSASFHHQKKTWNARAAYEDFSPGFRADMGFMPQVNFRKGVLGGNYIFWGKEGGFLTAITVGGDIDQTTDHDGNLIEREAQLEVVFEGPMQSVLVAKYEKRKYIYEETEFNQSEGVFAFLINPVKKLRIHFFALAGDGIDYDHVRAGKKLYISPSIRYNATKNFEIYGVSNFSFLHIDDEYLFKAYLNELRLIYFLNKNTFFRVILQYSDIRRNADLYEDEVDTREQGLLTQFLFSYKLNPRTVLYLGYSDIYEGYNHMSLLQSNRSVFLKIGYALVL
ncbi:MAG: carbohydrate binding family 9 domain-containing protein [Candidatus Aminicenantes bacterium]|nr:carbohydrate binding family 9 domain-containing protein [Candidatus Aminicenantes bacterium]